MIFVIRYLCSPKYFHRWVSALKKPLYLVCLVSFAVGLYSVFIQLPPDAVQGYTYRILYIHVPAAVCSLGLYTLVSFLSLTYLIWPLKIADQLAAIAARLGLTFTILVLITGSLWGKPMWGTWWIWDARLTSMLLLAFIYLGYLVLRQALMTHRKRSTICAIYACIGFVDLPIIHYSVQWWNTLHQGPTLLKFAWPSMHSNMLWPLLIMMIAFASYCASMIITTYLNQYPKAIQ